MIKQYYETLKNIYIMWYVIGGLVIAVASFIFGYLFCYRNPPESLKAKLKSKL